MKTKGIPSSIIENSHMVFHSAKYILEPDKNGKMVDRIWFFPLFTRSWACIPPFDRFEDEEIDIQPMIEKIQKSMEKDGDELLGFAFVESYWAENPKAQLFFGFFDHEKRMATRVEVYQENVKDSEGRQLFLEFIKQRMYDEPFEATSQELQEAVLTLMDMD